MSAKVKNMVLLGYKASGKTTLGRRLAELLGYSFLDTDALLEQDLHMPPDEFVKHFGWKQFRMMEAALIARLAVQDATIIACGGGVVECAENLNYLKSLGQIIFLDLNYDDIYQRLCHMGRIPQFVNLQHYQARKKLYETWAQFSIPILFADLNLQAQFLLQTIQHGEDMHGK